MLRARARPVPTVVFVAFAVVGGAARTQGQAAPYGAAPQGTTADTIELHRLVHFDELRALRSFFERVDVTSVADGVSPSRVGTSMAMGEVLNGLPSAWEAPFEFVQGAIRHVPYAGSVRGADGTLEAGAGNALDQSLLLQALLQARGVRARLVRGQLQWPDAARLVVGTRSPAPPRADDPWPRWLESAADHWWVQAERDGDWVDLDPSFGDAAVGQAMASSSSPQETVPSTLTTTVHIELLRGELALAEATVPAANIVGRAVSLSFVARSERATALWQQGEEELARQAAWVADAARGLGLLPVPVRGVVNDDAGEGEPVPRVSLPPRRSRPSLLRRAFLDPDAGPWDARLAIPGRTLEAGPFERADLDTLVLRISVRAPQAPASVIRAPWGGGTDGRLTVLVAAGPVASERLAMHARAIYQSLNRLASAEQAARVEMRPPIDYGAASETLQTAARAEWDVFERNAPEALAWVVLHGVERVSARSRVARIVRPGLRLAAVRWRPPAVDERGALEVLIRDPITVGQLAGAASAAALRAAYGLLQSAVFSQVLNRLTEQPPDTAFDVTLRAFGTGQRLLAVDDASTLPASWPATARAEAAAGVSAGYRVLAPTGFGDGGAGWWNISVGDGETLGWVPGVQSALQGRVQIGLPGRLEELDALLASLPSLHRALRWLSDLPGSGPTALATVPAAACASATVAADVMARSMPQTWPRPDVAGLCGPG
jgi:hypothetical protein